MGTIFLTRLQKLCYSTYLGTNQVMFLNQEEK